MPIKVGMGQMLVEGGRPEANLLRAESVVGEAVAADCDVVVLPECLDLGWTHPSARTLAEPIPGPRADELCRVARDHRIHVCAGLTERDGERIYNAAVLIDDRGRILLKHRKITILSIARDLYAVGDRLGVVDTPFGRAGVLICADNFPESLELGQSLCRMGANLILSPCAWAVPPEHDNEADPYGSLWRDAYGKLAGDRGVAVVGVSSVGMIEAGPWTGYRCIGCSLAVARGGVEALQAPYGAEAAGLFTVAL
ncbi:MAG: carbon-nitrogen hydrolase family protein [Candidatus Hydrogenedentes bacterium]|nr:carbon-nitrogen hydrolase family protein [Candidatus Hydrogenedentota bacterium]